MNCKPCFNSTGYNVITESNVYTVQHYATVYGSLQFLGDPEQSSNVVISNLLITMVYCLGHKV